MFSVIHCKATSMIHCNFLVHPQSLLIKLMTNNSHISADNLASIFQCVSIKGSDCRQSAAKSSLHWKLWCPEASSGPRAAVIYFAAPAYLRRHELSCPFLRRGQGIKELRGSRASLEKPVNLGTGNGHKPQHLDPDFEHTRGVSGSRILAGNHP